MTSKGVKVSLSVCTCLRWSIASSTQPLGTAACGCWQWVYFFRVCKLVWEEYRQKKLLQNRRGSDQVNLTPGKRANPPSPVASQLHMLQSPWVVWRKRCSTKPHVQSHGWCLFFFLNLLLRPCLLFCHTFVSPAAPLVWKLPWVFSSLAVGLKSFCYCSYPGYSDCAVGAPVPPWRKKKKTCVFVFPSRFSVFVFFFVGPKTKLAEHLKGKRTRTSCNHQTKKKTFPPLPISISTLYSLISNLQSLISNL